jgi:hypothetical protein
MLREALNRYRKLSEQYAHDYLELLSRHELILDQLREITNQEEKVPPWDTRLRETIHA